MVGQDILIPYQNSKIPAYLTKPSDGEAVGVVVISAIFGVDDDTQKICDRLAEAGYPAMAVNMFWQDETDSGPLSGGEHERAKARSTRVNRDDGNEFIKAAISEMKSLKSCNGKIAIFGFCYGGPYVVEAAAHHGIDGGVVFHGSYIEKFLPEFENISCPVEFHYGDNDAIAPMSSIELVKVECDRKGNRDLFVYPGGEHGYMFPNRGSGYLAEAADLSWKRAINLLKKL